jgi:hypothetical protein
MALAALACIEKNGQDFYWRFGWRFDGLSLLSFYRLSEQCLFYNQKPISSHYLLGLAWRSGGKPFHLV